MRAKVGRFGSVCAPLLLAVAGQGAETAKTFHDVWPILQAKCVGCHQPGEIGPMDLTSYRAARPWAAAIREAVASKTMPPWHAAGPTAHAFRNDRTLSADQIASVVSWADGGAREGDALPAFTPKQQSSKWKLGKPDLMVSVPGFEVPAKGVLQYSFLIVPLHFEHDTWIRAAEFRIDQRAVIHHINAFVRPRGSSYLAGFPEQSIFVPTVAQRGQRKPSERVFDRRELLLGYEPGYAPMPWMEGGAKLIRAGSDIIFEMHYNPNGRAVIDHSQLGLYFAPAAPRYRVLAIDTLRDLDLAIPPSDGDYHSTAAMKLAGEATLLSIQPHMHVRGKSMEVHAVNPDGSSTPLLNVPHYDFQWQTTYSFTKPVVLSSGMRLVSTACFDNSKNNKYNPAPDATVHWGDQTTDEMHIAFLELAIDARENPDNLLTELPKMVGTPPK